jgi:hypothetical protein
VVSTTFDFQRTYLETVEEFVGNGLKFVTYPQQTAEDGLAAVALLYALMGSTAACAESESIEDLAKEAQNPVAKLISIPIQDNINFNAGPQG